MVTINGKEVPSIRELVIEEQKRRTTRIEDEFIERMENNLIRWKPADSSHHNTILAVHGEHPYQQPTADEILAMRVANNRRARKREKRRKGITGDTSDSRILGIVGKWFSSSSNNKDSANNENIHEKGNILDPNMFGNDAESFAPRSNRLQNSTDTEIETLMAFPVSSNSAAEEEEGEEGEAEREVSTKRMSSNRSAITDKELELYRSYYKHPIPVSYLDSLRGNNKNNSKHEQLQGQAEPEVVEQKVGTENGWFKFTACLSSALCGE